MMIRSFCVCSIFILFTGCVAIGPNYQPAPVPEQDDALVYIYRRGSFIFGTRSSYYYLDGMDVAELSNVGYTWFHIPAGRYLFKHMWPWDVMMSCSKPAKIKVNWKPQETYYYRLSVKSKPHMQTTRLSWTLAQVSSNEAVKEMKQMHYQEAKRIKKHIVSFRARRRLEKERIQ